MTKAAIQKTLTDIAAAARLKATSASDFERKVFESLPEELQKQTTAITASVAQTSSCCHCGAPPSLVLERKTQDNTMTLVMNSHEFLLVDEFVLDFQQCEVYKKILYALLLKPQRQHDVIAFQQFAYNEKGKGKHLETREEL